MTRKFLIASLFAAATAIAACTTPAPKPDPEQTAPPVAAKALFDLPHVQKELPNGLRVIAVRTPQKGVVSLQIPVQTGSRNEVEPGKTGFAHFFEHMMFRGTPKYPADAYGALMKGFGADQNAYTDDDYTNYYVNLTVEDLEKTLEVEADRFRNLAYSEEQFRTEALAVKGEYLKNYSNPLLKGFEKLLDLAYTTHPYKHTTIGLFADIEDMPNQMDYAREFFARWYRPEYTSVIVVGDIEPDATVALVEKYWGGWQRGDYQAQIPQEPPQTQAKYGHVAFDGPTLPYVLVAWHAPAFATESRDNAALGLLGELSFGETSDLYKKVVVQERWADQFGYSSPRGRDPGLFALVIRLTDAAHTAKVVAAVDEALLKLRTHAAGAREIADTKSRLKYAFAAGMDSPASVGGILAQFVHLERDVESLNRYYAQFDAVTADDVLAAANQVFTDANRTAVSIANAKELAGAESFGALDAKVAAAGRTAAPADTAQDPFARPPGRDIDPAPLAEFGRMTVALVEQRNESPLVDVAFLFHSGSADDPPGKKGLAALTAAMIAEGGSQKYSYDEIRKALYPLAAPLSAQVDKEMTRFSSTVHRDNAARWWDIVANPLVNPGFREDDFARLKQQQINAVRVSLRANNDEELGKEALFEAVYGAEHPYGTLTAGHAKDLEGITLADVRTFYVQHYVRRNLTLGIAGGYDDRFANSMLASALAFNEGERRQRPVPQPQRPKANRALVIEKETPGVAVSFGWPIDVRRGDPDWISLWLVRSWLGEHRNSSGQLYTRIRDVRGMNYGDYAYTEYFPNGMFLMKPEPNHARKHNLFQVWLRPLRNNNDAHFATRVALHELQALQEVGLTAGQFEASRAFLHKFVVQLTATQSLQLGYSLDSQYYGTPEFTSYVREGLTNLQPWQVNKAIQQHLAPERIQYVFVTRDAQDLVQRLAGDAPSPIEYNSDKPADLLAEDKAISRLHLGLKRSDITVVKDAQVFE
jgi:zinc protease